jgi:hypothetical protein
LLVEGSPILLLRKVGSGANEKMGNTSRKEDDLIKDLKETTLSFEKLGERYGVLRNKNQEVSNISLN